MKVGETWQHRYDDMTVKIIKMYKLTMTKHIIEVVKYEIIALGQKEQDYFVATEIGTRSQLPIGMFNNMFKKVYNLAEV